MTVSFSYGIVPRTIVRMNTNIPIVLPANPVLYHYIEQLMWTPFIVAALYIAYLVYKQSKYVPPIAAQLPEATMLKSIYANIRDKYNGQQLEFPFVKAIDEEYVALRYNLNAEENE